MAWSIRRKRPSLPAAALTTALAATLVAALTAAAAPPSAVRTEYGPEVPLGAGTLRTYTQREGGRPLVMGVTFPAAALRNLPTAMSDGKHCFDKDGNGSIDLHTECAVGHEHILGLPSAFPAATNTPFTWSLVNWNPQGHIPMGVYDQPHFDIHFYLQPKSERDAIRPGPCPVLTNCDDYRRAKIPVPPRYLAPGHVDMDAVEPAMGNHLLDSAAPEFNGGHFTRTWIYGAYDGEITFYEAMVTKAWLEGLRTGSTASGCRSFREPRAWKREGWYPTRYCVGYRAEDEMYDVSLTGFAFRPAT